MRTTTASDWLSVDLADSDGLFTSRSSTTVLLKPEQLIGPGSPPPPPTVTAAVFVEVPLALSLAVTLYVVEAVGMAEREGAFEPPRDHAYVDRAVAPLQPIARLARVPADIDTGRAAARLPA